MPSFRFAAVSEEPPSWRQLTAVALASGLPFVVFGILDNGIMVGAGCHAFYRELCVPVAAASGSGSIQLAASCCNALGACRAELAEARNSTPLPRASALQSSAPQLVAGEQIDHLFGAKLGLSVLASAGLGNMVADVVGVSATHTIQVRSLRG